MKFDPKLREAMADIRAVCKRHDIGAQVILASESHIEFAFILDPTWSVARIEDNAVRIQSKGIADKAEKHRRIDATVHMVFATRDMLANAFNIYDGLVDRLNEQVDVEHKSMIGRAPDSVPPEPL